MTPNRATRARTSRRGKDGRTDSTVRLTDVERERIWRAILLTPHATFSGFARAELLSAADRILAAGTPHA